METPLLDTSGQVMMMMLIDGLSSRDTLTLVLGYGRVASSHVEKDEME